MIASYPFRAACVVLAASLLVVSAHAQDSAFAIVGKSRNYNQTTAGAVTPSTDAAFEFEAQIEGSPTSPTGPISVTLPGNSVGSALTYNSDGQAWRLRQNFTTQAALDAAFPSGTYTLTFGGKNIALPVNGDLYPNAPVATVSAGTWTSAGLVVDPAQPLTITINFTQNFVAGSSHLAIQVEGTGQNTPELELSSDDSGLALDKSQVSLTVPANSFKTGGNYSVQLEANRLLTFDTTSAAGYNVVSAYSSSVSFDIILPTPPTFTQQPQPNAFANVGGSATFNVQLANSNGVTYQWRKNGVNIAGATNPTFTINSVVTADAGVYSVVATNSFGSTASSNSTLTVSGPATITQQPVSATATAGGNVSLTVAATGTPPPSFQWRQNGNAVGGGNTSTYNIFNVQPANTGLYNVVATSNGSTSSDPAIVGLSTSSKVIGSGSEIAGDIPHPNGNIFDQILASGPALTFKADAGQVTRMSFIDLNDDITQIEFAGAGSVSVVFDGATGPAAPLNYNQPTVSYIKGHAGIVISGANETTNLSVFTVGRATAFDPTGGYNILLAPGTSNNPANNGSSLFVGKSGTVYDGLADIAFVAISSTNGKFGGLRTSNTSYFATKGFTGVYAPGVEFTGPLFIGDINAQDQATPMIVIGSGSDTRITGGDLLQANGQPVKVAGLTQLKFTLGSDSHGNLLAAKNNRAVLLQNGVDVTNQIVVNP
jgi:hypothetical protein